MVRLPAFFLSVFLISSGATAQRTVPRYLNTFSLRTNLLSFAELDGGIMIGAGYQWNKRFSTTLDPTIIFFNLYKNQNGDTYHPIGVKIRLDLRYHINDIFIAPEFHFKKVITRKRADFGINCIGRNCDFYMTSVYQEIKTEAGVSVKFGIDFPIDKRNRWLVEFYCGLGFKVNYFKERSIPTGGSFVHEPFNESIFGIPEGTAMPILPASIKAVYRLK